MSKANGSLAPPSLEFLEELRERARRSGWCRDYTEIADFLRELYKSAGISVPDLEPYESDDE